MSTRANFLSSTLAGASATLAGVSATFAGASALSGASPGCTSVRFPAKLAKPKMLRRGDLVGLVAPASPLAPGEIEQGITHMRSLGLRVRVGAFADAQNGYLAGTDSERAEDFNRMARDQEIRAIVALRGGYGTMRILDVIDYNALRRDPKIVLGFSDMTALLNAITRRSGIVTFHGALAARDTVYDSLTHERIERTLMQPHPMGVLHASSASGDTGLLSARTIVSGRTTGRLAGGNLSLLVALMGTPYAIATRDALVFFEETQEEDYRIDRMLTQLRLAGTFAAARGIIAGQFTDCGPVEGVLDERVGHLGKPAVSGFPIGHIAHQWILPIGIEAALDASAKTLTILEPAVENTLNS